MALPEREFNFRCAMLTDKLKYATGWKWNFFGAAYSTRLKELRKYLMELIEEIDKLIDDDTKDVFGLTPKERKLAEDIVNGNLS